MATAHGVPRVRHDLATKPPPPPLHLNLNFPEARLELIGKKKKKYRCLSSSTSYLVKKNSCFRLSPSEHELSFREARIPLLAPPVNTYVISVN